MTQLELFGDAIFEKLAREDDPPTSKAAAKEIGPKVKQLQKAFLDALKNLGRPSTAREIGERAKQIGLHGESESVRKRAKELERLGVIKTFGTRKCQVTGKPAQAWVSASGV